LKKIGLAIGGGGARGLTHIGILRVLEKEKIPIYCIAGTSMGAIIGACYAVEPDINLLESRIREILTGPLFSRMRLDFYGDRKLNPKKGLLSKTKSFIVDGYLHFVRETSFSFLPLEKLEQFINILLPDIKISDTKIPFACVATDLTNGRERIFTQGALRKCILASSAIPGLFPPVNIDGIYYNDGGSVNVTPINAAKRLNADYIIACDVKSRIMRWEKPEKAKEIIARSNYITGTLLNMINLKKADIIISPAVKHIHWTGFNKIDFMIEKGERAALQRIWRIKAAIKYKILLKNVIRLFKKKRRSA
jgi:NTE family protein